MAAPDRALAPDAGSQAALVAARRIVVGGTTGSGKTTLARRIAAVTGAPHVELDALHWEPGWTPAEPERFRARVASALAGPAWVVDGNYAVVRDLTWGAADTFVWLDYPWTLVLRRLLWRSLRRGLWREALWNGNRERLATQFMSRDSLFLWAVKTHGRHRREYPERLRQPEFAHLRVVRLRRPCDADRLLESLRAARASPVPGTPG